MEFFTNPTHRNLKLMILCLKVRLTSFHLFDILGEKMLELEKRYDPML